MTERRDATSVHEQCEAVYRRSDPSDGHLCCRFVKGHPGMHRTCYEGVGATDWDDQRPPHDSATKEGK
jgi:hypothetical protein